MLSYRKHEFEQIFSFWFCIRNQNKQIETSVKCDLPLNLYYFSLSLTFPQLFSARLNFSENKKNLFQTLKPKFPLSVQKPRFQEHLVTLVLWEKQETTSGNFCQFFSRINRCGVVSAFGLETQDIAIPRSGQLRTNESTSKQAGKLQLLPGDLPRRVLKNLGPPDLGKDVWHKFMVPSIQKTKNCHGKKRKNGESRNNGKYKHCTSSIFHVMKEFLLFSFQKRRHKGDWVLLTL